jgi:hypothetical protein
MDLKDHFEHLRTVHFSLIATCLLLLVVSTTSQNLTVMLAENQLSSMQSMVGHWSDLDFDAAIDRQVQASSMQVPRSRVLKFVNPVFVPKLDFTQSILRCLRGCRLQPSSAHPGSTTQR